MCAALISYNAKRVKIDGSTMFNCMHSIRFLNSISDCIMVF
jgi:hypothetical protein